MASVSMSQTLRDQITENYQKQLHTAYRKVHNVQPAIDTVIHAITDNDSEFATLCKLEDEHYNAIESVRARYKSGGYYSDHNVCENIVKTSIELGLICNPNRPQSENYCYIREWNPSYPDPYNENQTKEASESWVEGDVPVSLTDLKPFYTPTRLSIEYYQGWNKKVFAPHINGSALLVTDPLLCEQLSPVGEIEMKVGTDVATFKEYIDKITTLKRFIDEWPGGKDLVPDEYLQRMFAKAKPKAPANRMTPDQIIPDELKESMNEVLLTNKLMGDD
jgi:hypothetical protein|tara:strand:+ start:49 stop:879 length:831 start_codon:yes stop_codon:yes gene_type:complete